MLATSSHIRVEAGRGHGLAEGGLVHAGRAGADHNAGQVMFLDRVLDDVLARLGAHVLIIGGEDDAGFMAEGFRNRLDIDGRSDIAAAPTYEYANSLHGFSSLLAVFAHRGDDGLLGQIVIEKSGNIVGGHVVRRPAGGSPAGAPPRPPSPAPHRGDSAPCTQSRKDTCK